MNLMIFASKMSTATGAIFLAAGKKADEKT